MGTQQILLIVLGVIIVGVAVTIALVVFGTNAEQANKDALTHDCLKLVSNAQAYFKKPTMLGGGDNTFDGITIRDCGMETNGSGEGQNLSGTFSVIDASTFTVSIEGVSASNDAQSVLVTVDMTQTDPAQRLSVQYTGW